MNRSFILLCTMLAVGLGPAAQATVIPWRAMLDQAQEIPAPVAVPGAAGRAFGTVDDITGELSWNIAWTGLSGPALAMHFHGPAPLGGTAGVQVNIGDISGLTSPSVGMTTITADQVADLKDGLWYINIHTELNPPGEIRGQVSVHEPAAAALVGAGFLLLARVRRSSGRRRGRT